MTSFQTATYSSLLNGNSMANTSALRSVGCVHVLTGLVTVSIGVVSGALFVYLGWLCVGIWTGISFFICGIISIIAGKSANMLTVLLMACTHVLTLNFAITGAVITFSSLFPGPGFYTAQGDYSGVVHSQKTGTALGIAHLVVSFIEIVVCITGIRISWRILTSSVNAVGYRERSRSYDDPYLSSDNSYAMPPSLEPRRRTTENPTPPPTYDAATHSLSTSPKTVNGAVPRAARYGSMSESHSEAGAIL